MSDPLLVPGGIDRRTVEGPDATNEDDGTNLWSFSSRRSRAFWIFVVMSVGVLAFLVYSTVMIVYDAVQGDYDWVEVDSPNNDPKIYKYMGELLPNAPPIVVVQDPGAQLTGFAIGVSAGSYYDPVEFAGLAHFTEHMLFLGTESYPDPMGFDEFMSSHGGSSNAFTDSERTVYYNSIDTESFTEGFTRFVEFFTNPTFNRTYIEKEINAVDSEHDLHVNDPHWRMFSLISALSLPPNNHYSTGDSSTLLKRESNSNTTEASLSALETAVWEYFTANYCFNRLSIAIVSPLPVSDQIELVRNIFGSIPNIPIPQNCRQSYNFTKVSPELKSSSGWPIDIRNRQKIVYSQGVPDTLTMVWLAFPFRPVATNNEAGKHPFSVIETVLSHNGPNSLKQYLIANGFILSLSFMYDDNSAGSMGYITYEVPDRDRIGTLIETTMSFLAKWRKNGGISEKFVSDLQQIRTSLFYSNADASSAANNDPMRMAKYFAAQMVTSTRNRTAGLQEAPTLLSMNEVLLEVDPELANEVLNSMTTENMLLLVHDPEYDLAAVPEWVLGTAKNLAAAPQVTDPHYQFKYKVDLIKDEIADVWNSSVLAENITVFTNITVFPPAIVKAKQTAESRPNTTEVMAPPSLVFETDTMAIWYKPSVLAAASLPKVWLWSTIRPLAAAPLAGESPEEVQFNGEMIVDCVTFELRSQVADFILAGYDFVINWMFTGYFEVKVFGWEDRIDELLEVILKELTRPKMTFFTLILEEKENSLTRNRPLSDVAGEALNSLVVGSATRDDIAVYLNTYTPTKESISNWLRLNFDKAFYTIYVAGNPATISEAEAVELGKAYFATATRLDVSAVNNTFEVNVGPIIPILNFTTVVPVDITTAVPTESSTTESTTAAPTETAAESTTTETTTAVPTESSSTTTESTTTETTTAVPTESSSTTTESPTTETTTPIVLSLTQSSEFLPGVIASPMRFIDITTNQSEWMYFLAGPKFNKTIEVRFGNPAENDPNSALLYSLTFGSDMSSRERVLVALLSSIIDPLIFRTIRTQYQMGYIASGRAGVYPGPAGAVQYRVYIQGNVATPDLMEARLEELWDSVPAILDAIPLTEIEARAAGVAASMEETPTSAHEEVSQFWSAIHDQSYCFDRASRQANFLKTTDPAALKQGIIDIFTAFTTTRRSKVAVKVWSSEGSTGQPVSWNESILADFDNANVTSSLVAEKNATVFLKNVSKREREVAFQQSVDPSDPMWEPIVPECKM